MPSFFCNHTATTEIYTLSYTTLFRSNPAEAYEHPRGGMETMTATAGETCALPIRSEEHTSELQSLRHLVCRLFFVIIRRPPRSTLFPTRRSSDLIRLRRTSTRAEVWKP